MATTKDSVISARRLMKRAVNSLDQARLSGEKSDRDAAGASAAAAAKVLGHKEPAKKAPPKKAPPKKAPAKKAGK